MIYMAYYCSHFVVIISNLQLSQKQKVGADQSVIGARVFMFLVSVIDQ